MQCDMECADLTATLESANLEAIITPQTPLEVVIGNEVQIDVGETISYIKKGTEEIEAAAREETAAFNLNASNKITAYNNNANSKISLYNNNADQQTLLFNDNAESKTSAFNVNAAEKQTAVNAAVTAAENFAAQAQSWAIKTNGTVDGSEYSSKYYAAQAAEIVASINQSDIVHKTGAETISGTKTFSSALYLMHKNAEKGETGTARYWLIPAVDKNGTNRIGMWQTILTVDGDVETALYAYKNDANSSAYSSIRLVYPLNGNPYMLAPNSDVVGAVITSKAMSKQASGYVQLGNGVIINWGKTTVQTSMQSETVTFSKAFSNNNAAHVAVQAGGATLPKVTSLNSTSFILSREQADASASPATYTWIAVGY